MAIEIEERVSTSESESLSAYSDPYYSEDAPIEILVSLSKEQFKKIEAGAYYNNANSIGDFIVDSALEVVETTRERYLKTREANKIKK